MNQTKKGNAFALLPILVFLLVFLGGGILFNDFYAMPAVVAFMIALFVAFLQNKKMSFAEKITEIAKGAGDENIITMCLIFLCAGAFSGSVTAAGGVESTVNFGLSILPVSMAVVGLFVIACFISVAMGTSVGTITALAPIATGIAAKTGFSPAICIGAVLCGAMFGDNLSMISDTTIAAVKTQGCQMKDKFKENFLIVLPAAVLTIILLYFLSRNGGKADIGDLTYNLWQVLPYIFVLIGALVGLNVFIVLLGGTALSLIVGVSLGTILPGDIFKVVGTGVTSMYDITVISILVACIIALVKKNGGIDFILYIIHKCIRGKKGAELGISGLALFTDACTANNTVAIVIAGPIAKEISEDYEISPRRSASLLDIFSSVGQGLIPYGAQMLTAATLSGITPFHILPYAIYPTLMAISAILFIVLRKK